MMFRLHLLLLLQNHSMEYSLYLILHFVTAASAILLFVTLASAIFAVVTLASAIACCYSISCDISG
jgi:hypothetical protein